MIILPTFPLTKEVSLLNFWREKQYRWESLAKVVKKILGVPASSSAVERIQYCWSYIFTNNLKKNYFNVFVFAVYSYLLLIRIFPNIYSNRTN